jgi:hypothetical protein
MADKLYRIKPLEWVLVNHPSHMPYWTAQTPYGWYYHVGMLLRHGYVVKYRVQGRQQQCGEGKRFNTVEEAIASAEADYREFMAKWLEEVSPVPASIPVADSLDNL